MQLKPPDGNPMTKPRFSYRNDPSVPPFDDSRPLVIFDGMCVLCSSGVHWMLARDPKGGSLFAAIQEPVPRALYTHYGLDADTFETFMVLSGGAPYTKWEGILAAARTMPQPWRGLAVVGRLVPGALGDAIYDWVQRNRLRWFGTRGACLKPQPGEESRFLALVRNGANAGEAQ